jgi:hypothetical protein
MTTVAPLDLDAPLLADIRQLIDAARRRAAATVNAELTLLYWQVGRRIQAEVLGGAGRVWSAGHFLTGAPVDGRLRTGLERESAATLSPRRGDFS